MRIFQLLLWGLLAAGPAHAEVISGTYVGKSPNSATLVQIVETPGGKLTGRYEQTILMAGGKLSQTSEVISGASDGHTVVVTFKQNEYLSGVTASGTIDAALLHVSGTNASGAFQLNLTRSDEATYRAMVASLSDQAGQIIEAQERADELARLNKLTKDMATYSASAQAQLPKFAPIEQRYRAITVAMDAALRREGTIYGGGQARLIRGQVRMAIDQVGMEAAQLHSGIVNDSQEIRGKLQPVIKGANESIQHCQSNNVSAAPDADLHAACAKFFDAAKGFNASIEKLSRAFDQAENVWIEERRKQEGIIQASAIALQ